MKKHILNAEERKIIGRKVKHLRKKGIIPANIFGKKSTSKAISVSGNDFKKVYDEAGETSLIEISIKDKKIPVLISSIQYHPLTSSPLHVDFHQVDLKEKVTAKVPVLIMGEAPAVKDKLGVLLNLVSELEVEALPMDLPEKIEVMIDNLKAVNEVVKVENLKISDKIKIINAPEQDIVKVAPLVSKEAEKMAQEQAAAAAATAAAAAAAATSSTGTAGAQASSASTISATADNKSGENKS